MNVFESFKNFLVEEELSFIEREGKTQGVNLRINSGNGILYVAVTYIAEKNTLLSFVDYPIRVPRTLRNKMLDFISFLNTHLLLTNFILDDNGFLQLKNVLYSSGEPLEKNTFKLFLYTNISTMDFHFKKITAVLQQFSQQKQINLN